MIQFRSHMRLTVNRMQICGMPIALTNRTPHFESNARNSKLRRTQNDRSEMVRGVQVYALDHAEYSGDIVKCIKEVLPCTCLMG